jgi:hypothetical protein
MRCVEGIGWKEGIIFIEFLFRTEIKFLDYTCRMLGRLLKFKIKNIDLEFSVI